MAHENTIRIKVSNGGGTNEYEVEAYSSLLHFLRDKGYSVPAPCGGNGTCGKCLVRIEGEGMVTACSFFPSADLSVILPDEKTAQVLTEQSRHCIKLPFNPAFPFHLSALPYGLAIDIGTTTMAFYFVNLGTGVLAETRTMLNPQSKYGSDVISRINHCAVNPGGLKHLQDEIVGAINTQVAHFAGFEGISGNDLVKLAITGNPTMLHFLLGVDPVPMAFAPFTPGFISRQVRNGQNLGLFCNPEAEVDILPSVSAYVGADIVAGLASLDAGNSDRNYLFVDIGTNGEMALVTPGKIFCCATAAGPAFEGANISCGTGAVDGAISAFAGGIVQTVGNGKPCGICGSGLIDIVAWLVESGIVDPEGYMADDYLLFGAGDSATGTPIVITPADIREVQLAKSAVASGIKILLSVAELSFSDLDCLYLAGGFGNYIGQESAVKIGLLPAEMAGKIIPVGNTSGAGALLALRSSGFGRHISETLRKTEYTELSGRDDFMTEFAMNMYFGLPG